jgi:hypothetical protein
VNCDCFERSNEALQKTHPGVYLRCFVDIKTGNPTGLVVAADRLTGKGKVPPIIANFCPFCGVAYGEVKSQ